MTDARTEILKLRVGTDDVRAELFRPDGAPRAAVVLGAEAVGINSFIRTVGTRLAKEGYLAIVPDYFHGAGPEDPDRIYDWEHVPDIQQYIAGLDFRQGTEDMFAAIDHAQRAEGVSRVAVWGYCTGGTMSMLAACLERDVQAAVLFYPSQPTFHDLTEKTPVHPVDLIWNVHGALLLLLGDQDPVWPAEVVETVRSRLTRWSIPHQVKVYEGAGHVFAGHFGDSFRPEADADSWQRSLRFLAAHLGGPVRPR